MIEKEEIMYEIVVQYVNYKLQWIKIIIKDMKKISVEYHWQIA